MSFLNFLFVSSLAKIMYLGSKWRTLSSAMHSRSQSGFTMSNLSLSMRFLTLRETLSVTTQNVLSEGYCTLAAPCLCTILSSSALLSTPPPMTHSSMPSKSLLSTCTPAVLAFWKVPATVTALLGAVTFLFFFEGPPPPSPLLCAYLLRETCPLYLATSSRRPLWSSVSDQTLSRRIFCTRGKRRVNPLLNFSEGTICAALICSTRDLLGGIHTSGLSLWPGASSRQAGGLLGS
mmetsp:Transcript_2574/g.9160  ORF Transcript_2574/g.9160 Transcript_2574/m.9160 type:complete len:234 (-) Transcript_2574:668-1369(-)